MFKFPLQQNEKLLAMIRQTEWVLLKPVVIIVLAAYLPWFYFVKYELLGQYFKLLIFWNLLLLIYGIYKYLLWLLNVNLVTNTRVAIITYKGITDKTVSEAPFGNIGNISYTSKGLAQSLLDFGNVAIRLANTQEVFYLKNVRHPHRVKDFIWKRCPPAGATIVKS